MEICNHLRGNNNRDLMQYYVETHASCGISLTTGAGKSEKDFNQLIEEFKKFNLLGEKKTWVIILNQLRDWRNFVHLRKELKEGYSLDEAAFKSIEPIFEAAINIFAKNW